MVKIKLSKLGSRKYMLLIVIAAAISLTSIGYVHAVPLSTPVEQMSLSELTGGLLAAAIAISVPSIAAAIAIYGATTAGAASMAERPEVATWILIFAGLGEGLAIYGLVVAIMILGKI